MSDTAHTEVYKGYRIVLKYDTDASNPRKEYDNLGHMVCFHKRYDLGDEHNYENPQALILDLTYLDEDELGRNPNDDLGDGSKHRIVWEPLYLYDHSGITMRTTPFGDPWDSGQVGVIYITYDAIAKDLGLTDVGNKWTPTPEQIAVYEKILKGEVETYDQYIRGDVYGYSIYAADEEAQNVDEDEDPPTEDDDEFWMDDEEESCWGFFGEAYAIQEAKDAIDAIIDQG